MRPGKFYTSKMYRSCYIIKRKFYIVAKTQAAYKDIRMNEGGS